MFKCDDCGRTFYEPKLLPNTVPYGSQTVTESTLCVCPYCGGHFEETKPCVICGNEYSGEDIDGVCPYCVNILKMRHSEILKEKFSPLEIKVLNVAYDGEVFG